MGLKPLTVILWSHVVALAALGVLAGYWGGGAFPGAVSRAPSGVSDRVLWGVTVAVVGLCARRRAHPMERVTTSQSVQSVFSLTWVRPAQPSHVYVCAVLTLL